MKQNKVFIVNGGYEYSKMFRQHGWGIVGTVEAADLVQFTGGEDVTPSLYGQAAHARTCNNPIRDRQEARVFKLARKLDKPMAGICRGGQFLNVMSGGSMWQDVNKHTTPHEAKDTRTGQLVVVTSTHHQMMIPGEAGEVILDCKISTFKVGCKNVPTHIVLANTDSQDERDIEAVYYRKFNTFCFQPHPEFERCPDLAKAYMDYLTEFFGFKISP